MHFVHKCHNTSEVMHSFFFFSVMFISHNYVLLDAGMLVPAVPLEQHREEFRPHLVKSFE